MYVYVIKPRKLSERVLFPFYDGIINKRMYLNLKKRRKVKGRRLLAEGTWGREGKREEKEGESGKSGKEKEKEVGKYGDRRGKSRNVLEWARMGFDF